IVSGYTFLTAAELWRERRNALQQRWPALCVPFLHGAIFLFPVPAVSLLPHDGTVSLATGWIAVFALEIMLYAVGTAFIILTLASERSVRLQRDAASTDDLTGLLNRRGFQAAARELVAGQAKSGGKISVLVFDLDHFKSINDRFGHLVGDQTLRTFAATAAGNMRSSDVVARFGGEEFAAMLPGSLADATTVAERVRMTFAALTETVCGHPVGATVSVGAASRAPTSARCWPRGIARSTGPRPTAAIGSRARRCARPRSSPPAGPRRCGRCRQRLAEPRSRRPPGGARKTPGSAAGHGAATL